MFPTDAAHTHAPAPPPPPHFLPPPPTQIVNGYEAGEVDIDFEPSVTTVYRNQTEQFRAHVQTYGGVYMRWNIVSGPHNGKTLQVKYQKSFLNMMDAINMAWSALDGTMPASFDDAMHKPDDSFVLFKCVKDSAECKFVNPHHN